MKLHDNHSFDQKHSAGLPRWEGKVTIEIEAYAANESDILMQLIQTLGESDVDQLLEQRDELQIDVSKSE